MPWQDRLREAAYRSPNGTRTVFTFQDVSRVVEKKTSAFDFPDADGTLIQDLGRKGRRYPLRVIFAGNDHDLEADAFEQTLLERGSGVLEHPRYGQVDVVPFGEITQRDDLKTRANQTIIEVVFWSTIGTAYPTSDADGVLQTLAVVNSYQEAAAQQLEETLRTVTQFERVTFRGQWESFLDNVESALSEVADFQDDISRQFNDINDSINRGLDVLVGQPLTLAFQTIALIKAPARAIAQIEARLNAYSNLVNNIVNGSSSRIGTGSANNQPQLVTPTNDSRASNELASRQVFAQGAIAGSVTAAMSAARISSGPNGTTGPGDAKLSSSAKGEGGTAVNIGAFDAGVSATNEGGFATQPQAIAAAEQILGQLEVVTNWADRNYKTLDGTGVDKTPVVDTGASYQQLQKAVALTAGVLIQLSFNLRQERRITLDRARSLYDFVGEYYGDIDANLDFFINSNNLTGSEILELPKGRTVVVYG